MIRQQRNYAGPYVALLGFLLCLTYPVLAHAVPMVNDPNGFQNLAWGVTLTARPDLEITRAGPHVNEYRLRESAPSYAGIPVESLRLLSVDEQFARVTIHYQGEGFPVNKDRFIIGRGKQTSDLTIKDPNVSRQHAMIEFSSGQYYIVDMGSTNGVEYNGQRVQRKAIAEGDIFRVCDHELRFSFH